MSKIKRHEGQSADDAEAFLDFLLEAKRATYASGAGPSSSSRPGSTSGWAAT